MTLTPHVFVLEMKKLLGGCSGWLDKAVAHATAKKFDANTLLHARIAPDMFPLARQIQSACDQAKFTAARLAGRDAPSHPDTEQTIDELKKRIATVQAYLDTFKAEDFAGAETRTFGHPRWEGKSMAVLDYLVEHSQPNFYFHLTMTYAILRHNGVEIGKRDFLGAMTYR
jgi:uncharacterized protein